MKNNKFGLIIIVPLLIIGVLASIVSLYQSKKLQNEAGNLNHEHKLNGKLYYYNEEDELVGFYTCTDPNCEDATTTVDETYNHSEYEYTSTTIPLNDNKVFIKDGNIKLVQLNGLNEAGKISEFDSIKNYGGLLKDFIIVESDGKWGMLNAEYKISLPLEYDFIGASADFGQEKFVAYKDGQYQIVNSRNIKVDSQLKPIVDFDASHVYLYDEQNLQIEIVSKKSDELYKDLIIRDYKRNSMMFVAVTDDSIIIMNNLLTEELKKFENSGYTITLSGDTLNVMDKGEVKYTYTFQG